MKRRNFISNSLKGAIVPFFVSGMGIRNLGSASFLPAGACDLDERALVVIHLNGANDIINAAVPLNQIKAYQNHRPNIFIPTNKLQTLDSSLADNQQLGFNPALQSFKSLYDDGLLSLIQRAGYPSPNRSHFASEAIMLKGTQGGSDKNLEEGWIGRFLRDRYANFQGLPFGKEPDPLGIMLGKGSTAGFHTNEEHDYHLNLTGQDPAGFFNIISSLSGQPLEAFPNSDHGNMLEYITAIEKTTQVYSSRISEVFNTGTNQATYPDSTIGDQLKTIARFLSGGSKTKVFFARTGGWDTHVNEVDTSDTTKGRHADLLKDLSDSIKAFQDDVEASGVSRRVTTVIFSEFGRKIIQNERGGTDHGTLSSMFVVGKNVNPGVYGSNIILDQQDERGAADPAQLENDYRSVFASLLQYWMGASDSSLKAAFPNTADNIILNQPSFINPNQAISDECLFTPGGSTSMAIQLNVFLEGFYDPIRGKMTSELVAKELLPKDQPFTNNIFQYFGQEQVTNFPAQTVDWLLVELRSKETFTTIARQAVLLKEDGSVMNINGEPVIRFSNVFPDEYHVVVCHQAHICIITKETTTKDENSTHSFVLDSPAKVQGTNQLKKQGNNYLMIVGDLDQNGAINAADYTSLHRGTTQNAYVPSDLNGSGSVGADDSILFKANRSKLGYPNLFPKMKI